MLAGVFYICLPALCLVWLRGQGRETLFWLLFVVWATDIGAYAAGRAIGGPKLMPRVSPEKNLGRPGRRDGFGGGGRDRRRFDQ